MAATYEGPAGRASLSGGSRIEQILLPNGACSFRDLAAGVQAPTCGCHRFWVDNTAGTGLFCFCGHHACYHENGHPVQREQGQSRRSAVNVFPSSHQANAQSQPGAPWIPPTWSELIGDHDEPSTARDPQVTGLGSATGLGIRNSQPQSQPRSINTRLWRTLNEFARDQDGDRNSNHSSYLPSTAVPSLYDEPPARRMAPPVTIPVANINEHRTDEYSATEVATPSVRATPDFRTLAPSSSRRDALSPPHPPVRPLQRSPGAADVARQESPTRASRSTPPPAVSSGPSLSIQEMCNTIQDYGRRINWLEGVSFSHMPSAEVQERFELVDGRLLDLELWRKDEKQDETFNDTQMRLDRLDDRLQDVEDWRVDQENLKTSQEADAADAPSSAEVNQDSIENASFASDGSFDETAAVQTETVVLATLAAHAETGPRIDALESRIVDLESAALPTFARPWHIQVVLLPFGRELPGVWFTSTESSYHSISSASALQVSEEWTGLASSSKTSFHSVDSSDGAWTTESIEAWTHGTQDEWLSPKACGPSGTVFQRLASRGLVQNIVLQSSEARHICRAIASAFDGILQSPQESFSTAAHAQCLGLKEPFIPLRKVRKSSRLRFLSRAEMATPALWNAGFLESGVFMKVGEGERRLYLTTPQGYTQPARPCWTWPALRSLTTYDVAGEVQQAQAAGNVVEACWTRNAHLDHTTSLPSSFHSSQNPSWGESHKDGSRLSDQREDVAMLSPTATRHSDTRSLSLPSSDPVLVKSLVETESIPKRRVASFEIDGQALVSEHAHGYLQKRRRISISPELERRGITFTPRWSREPLSPYVAEDIGGARNSQPASCRDRGTTPFAYPTPHSHFDSRDGVEIGEAETGHIADVVVSQSGDAETGEEWEGVQEQDRTNSEQSFNHYKDEDGEEEEDDDDDQDILNDGRSSHDM